MPKLIITELPSVLHGSAIEGIMNGKKSYAHLKQAMKYPNPAGTPPLVDTGKLKPALDLVLPLGVETEKLEVGYTTGPIINPPECSAEAIKAAAEAFQREMEEHVIQQLGIPPYAVDPLPGAPFIHTIKWEEQPLWPIVWQVVGEFGICLPLPMPHITSVIESLRDDLAAEIERRLPDEFTQNRSALAHGLLEAQLDFERGLMAWDRKWNR